MPIETKTLQAITEQLRAAGVPVFVADVKGDLSRREGKRLQNQLVRGVVGMLRKRL